MPFDRWSTIKRLRQPEYVGSDRCLPCTVVNVVVTGVLTLAASLVFPLLGAIVFGTSLVLIYFRGYLVPGTPTLTKRYFPARLLRLFDKDPAVAPDKGSAGRHTVPGRADAGADGDLDGSLLDRTEVLVECPDRDDLCLEKGFQETWRENMLALRSDERRQHTVLVSTLDDDVEPDVITLHEGSHVVEATVRRVTVGEWPSRAALIADLAAGLLLADRDPRWREIDVQTRGTALARLRIFLEKCPECDKSVDFHEEDGSACCWSREVITVRCTGCDARILEVDELSFDDGRTAFL